MFGTGIPRVGKSEPVPVPANTVPVTGTGTYRTVICAVSHETRGFYLILFFIFTIKNIVENQKPSQQGSVLVNNVRRGFKMCRYGVIEVL